MVGIAQPENFSPFLRKVGYSVGLENTLSRFSDFCREYASVPQLKISHWSSLVHDKARWDLRTENIADVFASLGIAQVNSQGVFAGPFGEAGSICIRLLETETEREDALRHLLALGIFLADGDIFLNCLAAQFNADDVPSRLTGMVLGKRQELFELFKSQAEREAIAGAITIERQRSNKGGASKGSRLSVAASAGLAGGLAHLGLPKPKDVHRMDPPSSDYLRHILPSRREWARTLGLSDKDGAVNAQGWRWLECIGKAGFVFSSGEYSLRPTKFELERNRLSSSQQLMARAPSTWDYVSLVASALTSTEPLLQRVAKDNELATFTRRSFEAFREFAQDRRMVRNELPLFVALSAYMAISKARGESLVDYDAWLRSDTPQQFGIKTRSSRTIELGLTVSTHGHD
jgi:hypothetical protein